MKYSVATIATLASAASAAQFLNSGWGVVIGTPFTIKFHGCEDGCTIILQTGIFPDLNDVETLTTTAKDGSFTWTPSDLPTGKYNFKIIENSDPTDVNYSSQFTIEGDVEATTTVPTTTELKLLSSTYSETPRNSSITATTSSSSDGTTHGPSPGALAGIVVGTVAAVLFVLAVMFFWWRKRKARTASQDLTSRHEGNAPHPQITQLEQHGKVEMPVSSPTSPIEMGGPPLAVELSSQRRSLPLPAPELDSEKQLASYSGIAASRVARARSVSV